MQLVTERRWVWPSPVLATYYKEDEVVLHQEFAGFHDLLGLCLSRRFMQTGHVWGWGQGFASRKRCKNTEANEPYEVVGRTPGLSERHRMSAT
eukprot:1049891-Amphidinium_carterae.1